MEKEHPNIINEDWRLQVISTLAKPFTSPETGHTHPIGTPVSVVSLVKYKDEALSFKLPNTTALFLDFAYQLWAESESVIDDSKFTKRTKIKNQELFVSDDEEFFNLIEMRMGAIVFAYTAIESFTNEQIPNEYIFKLERDDRKCIESYNKEQIEKNINLETKLCLVLPDILGIKSPKGGKLWNKYKTLKDLRDRIIHMKSVDKKSSGPEEKTIWRELLSLSNSNFAIVAKEIIAYYILEKNIPRWLNKFPFKT